MDTLTPEKRSWNMSRIRSKDTRPEIQLRSLLHRAGYRFSLHRKELTGTPDIVLRKYRTVIFVHGCFWHRHKGCKYATTPSTHKAFWKQKFERNIANDKKHARALRKQGWKVLTVWECQLKHPEKVLQRLKTHLTMPPPKKSLQYPENIVKTLPIAAEAKSVYSAPNLPSRSLPSLRHGHGRQKRP